MNDRNQNIPEQTPPELSNLKKEYLNVTPPPQGIKNMTAAIEQARKEKNGHKRSWSKNRSHPWSPIVSVAAAAMVILVITPNISPAAAAAMEQIPVLGSLIKVVTLRNYQVANEFHQADVSIPEIQAEGNVFEAAKELNQSTQDYIDTLIKQFETDIANAPEGHQGLDVDYAVVTDSDSWFTLKVSALETRASGYQQERYYHINKQTGQMAHLKDLFQDGADYISAISENIKVQMQEQMNLDDLKVFWLNDPLVEDENFTAIKADQNFYFNSDHQLVIVFDKYAVAPGYMGVQEFVIPDSVLSGLRIMP